MSVLKGSLAIVGVMTLTGCISLLDVDINDSDDRVRGSGLSATESRRVAGIRSVSVSGVGLVVIDRTGQEALTITADHNILPLITSEVRGDRLYLGLRNGYSISPNVPIEYRLTVRELDDIVASGAVEVDAAGLDTRVLTVNLSGSSSAIVAGSVRRQDVIVSGAAHYWADDLLSRIAVADVSGAAYILVNASQLLDVHVSGAALVEYLGRPEVRATVSGAAELRPR